MIPTVPTQGVSAVGTGQTPPYQYGIYGISLHSEFPLPLPEFTGPALAEIILRTAPASEFQERTKEIPLQGTTDPLRNYARLPDGSSYVQWRNIGEFIVSPDGGDIRCCPAPGYSPESFHTYLLGQALSFALVKKGLEPQHATAVVIDGKAVAFIADCGSGKSTLAAGFLHAGYPILTDDLMVIQPSGSGFVAHPGPARVKLLPEIARELMGDQVDGVPMNSFTHKMIISLRPDQVWPGPVPLEAIYVLAPPPGGKTIRFHPLSPRKAFVALVQNTFNYLHDDADRLARQFKITTSLAETVPLSQVSYPRISRRIDDLCDAIIADVNRPDLKGIPAPRS